MARYEHLPIYKQSLDVAVHFENVVAGFSRYHKYTQRVRQQYRYFHWRFPQDIVFVRVGKFIEFYDIITPFWLEPLGLQSMGWNRRGARYGFPVKQLWQKMAAVLLQGCSVLYITEQVSVAGGIRERVPLCRFSLA